MKEKLWIRWEEGSFILLAAYLMECVAGCSGRWLTIGGVSIRMLLFAACFAATLPAVLRHFKEAFCRPSVVVSLLFALDLLLMAVIGYRHEHSKSFIAADITSFLSLALLPGFLATVRTREQVRRLLDCLYAAACILAFITVGIHFVLPHISLEAVSRLNDWINERSLGGLATLTTGLQRVYFKGQVFLQVALLLGIERVWQKNKKWRIGLYACQSVLAFACILSYTRGFWLGLAISAVALLVLCGRKALKCLQSAGLTLIGLCLLLLLSWANYGAPLASIEIVNRFDPQLIVLSGGEQTPAQTPPAQTPPAQVPVKTPAASAPVDSVAQSNENAAKLRAQTLDRALPLIAGHPVLGNGLGTNLDGLREDGKIEYMYLDVLMKTGAIGFILFCAVFFGAVLRYLICWLRGRFRGDEGDFAVNALVAGYLGVAMTSVLNPFLSNPMGIALLMLIIAALQQFVWKEREKA